MLPSHLFAGDDAELAELLAAAVALHPDATPCSGVADRLRDTGDDERADVAKLLARGLAYPPAPLTGVGEHGLRVLMSHVQPAVARPGLALALLTAPWLPAALKRDPQPAVAVALLAGLDLFRREAVGEIEFDHPGTPLALAMYWLARAHLPNDPQNRLERVPPLLSRAALIAQRIHPTTSTTAATAERHRIAACVAFTTGRDPVEVLAEARAERAAEHRDRRRAWRAERLAGTAYPG
jgi:hypothetical protein